MEQWEIDYREKLEKEIPHGYYEIGNDDFVALTGKYGYINYLVEFRRRVMGLETFIPKDKVLDVNTYGAKLRDITEQDIIDLMKKLGDNYDKQDLNEEKPL